MFFFGKICPNGNGFRLACFWEGVEGKNALEMFGMKRCLTFNVVLLGVVKEKNRVVSFVRGLSCLSKKQMYVLIWCTCT